MARTDHSRYVHGDAFIDEQLAKTYSLSSVPVRVIAFHIGDDLPHLTLALGRRIANSMRNLMGKP